MALTIKTNVVNTATSMGIIDATGNYDAVTNPGGWIAETARTFTTGVNVSTDILTLNDHGFYMGQVVTYTFGSGSGMASITTGTKLYVNVVDANSLRFSLYPTYPGLIPYLDLNNATLTGTHSLTPYNDVRARVSNINLVITPPNKTALSAIPVSSSYWINNYGYDLTSYVTLAEGVWQYDFTWTIDSLPVQVTAYQLRDEELKCAIGKLALNDLCKSDYAAIKFEYDRMRQAFECTEYEIAQDIYNDINDMLVDCNGTGTLNCGCGC